MAPFHHSIYAGPFRLPRSEKKKGRGETVLKDLIHEELETLQERMDHLDPKERLDVLVKLLPYILPKCTHTTAEINVPRKPPS